MTSIRFITALSFAAVLTACSQAPRIGAETGASAAQVVPSVQPSAVSTQAPAVQNVLPTVVPAKKEKNKPAESTDGEYRIGVDDMVMISVWRNPELSVEVPVRPDGYISAPLIGDVEAGGLTAAQVAVKIEAKLEQYIRQPKVSVILTNLVSHQFLTRVRVTGAINKPISLPYRQGMTVLDIVLEAGGLSDFAVPARARLYRKDAKTGKASTVKVRLDKIIYKGDLSTNVELKAGDVLTVPERRF